MPSIFERIQAKIELMRLEKRYTRHRNRRSTFQSNAVYVDGEYVYQTPNSTGSSAASSSIYGSPSVNALHSERPLPAEPEGAKNAVDPASPNPSAASSSPTTDRATRRFSAMPGFGAASPPMQQSHSWRSKRASVQGTSW